MAATVAATSKSITDVPMLIGGRLENSTSDRHGDVFNPSTGKVQARVPYCTTGEVERAVQAASEALPAISAETTQPSKTANTGTLIATNPPTTAASRSCPSGPTRRSSNVNDFGNMMHLLRQQQHA